MEEFCAANDSSPCRYSFVNHSKEAVMQLITKMAGHILTMVTKNLTNPDVLLFWSCNGIKLVKCFGLSQDLYELYSESGKQVCCSGLLPFPGPPLLPFCALSLYLITSFSVSITREWIEDQGCRTSVLRHLDERRPEWVHFNCG